MKGEKNHPWFEWDNTSRVLLREDPITFQIQFTVEFVLPGCDNIVFKIA